MHPWSKYASVFIALASLAGLAAGQTATPRPSGSAPSVATVNPPVAGTSSAQDKPPDLTFKPNPADKVAEPPRPVAPPAATTPESPEKPAPAAAVPPVAVAPAAEAEKTASSPDSTAADPPVVIPKVPELPLYVLGPNDVLAISVFGEKTVPGNYSIGPDGRVSLPLLGDFTAVGLTIPQLQALITEKLKAYIIDPVVNVQLLRNNSKKYTLIGGVAKTGPFPLLQETTVLDALAAAGGFKDFANPRKIIVRRGTKEFHFNYKDVIKGKNMDQNITIQDGDIIVVPE